MRKNLDILSRRIDTIIFEYLAKGESVKIDSVGVLVPKNHFAKGATSGVRKVITLQAEATGDGVIEIMEVIEPIALEAGFEKKTIFNNWYRTCLIENNDEKFIFRIKETVTVVINKKNKTVEITASNALQKYLNPMNSFDSKSGAEKGSVSKKRGSKTESKKKSLVLYIIAAVIILSIAVFAVYYNDIFPEKANNLYIDTYSELKVEEKVVVEQSEDTKKEVVVKVIPAKIEPQIVQQEEPIAKPIEPAVPAKPLREAAESQLVPKGNFLVLGSFKRESNVTRLKNKLKSDNIKFYTKQRGRLCLVMIKLEKSRVSTLQERQIKSDYAGSWYFINK